MTEGYARRPRVGLFVTCLVGLMRPSVGFAAVRLLEAAGCEVLVPRAQTCCGQPAYNSGDKCSAKSLALQSIAAFVQGFSELGYVQGQHYVIEYRWAEGQPERLVPLGAELAALKLDVIYAPGGDNVLDAAAVANPEFGCAYTDLDAPRIWDNAGLAFLAPPACPAP